MSKSQEIEQLDLGVNPFLSSFKFPVKRVYLPDEFIENESGVKMPSFYDIEIIVNTKLYKTAGVMDLVSGLTDKAQRLLFYVIFHLEQGKDYFRFNQGNYMAKNSIKSPNTVRNAISELVKKSIIARVEDNKEYFFINPAILFSGNRGKAFPSHKVIKNPL